MKNLKELKGVKMLSNKEQKQIEGGTLIYCNQYKPCPSNYGCVNNKCVLNA